jgi:hypothetical protein
MPTPYTSGPHILEAVGGEELCQQIRAPHRGTIRSIKMQQVGGVAAACDFAVFTSSRACPPNDSNSSESLSEQLEGPRSAYSIFGTKVCDSGEAFQEHGQEYIFRNADGSSTNPQRKLYVALRPEGTGGKVYALTLEMEVSPV